ncbi:MAG: hypothetical protein R2809_08010 [Flavobacteriales bacterium]
MEEANEISVDNCSIQIISVILEETKVSKMDYLFSFNNLQTAHHSEIEVTTNFNPPLEMVTEYCMLGYETEVTLITG